MNEELFNSISRAKIQESIYLVSKLILKDVDKNIDIINITFINLCSYIGSFISVYDIKLWIDIIENLIIIINNDKIIIKDIYMLIAKMCVVCDIYIKNPVVKTGTINIKLLRSKIIHYFEDTKFKLSQNGSSKFEGLLPPVNSESYNLSIQIITGIVNIIKQIESSMDFNNIHDLANNLRNVFDYIIRKKYVFETKFYESDNDAIWFLWGILCILSNDNELDLIFQLFNYDYVKKYKNQRLGLLWGSALVITYLKKKDIARSWNSKELRALQKIDEIGLELYNDIKKLLIKNEEIEPQKQENNSINGIDYFLNYKPYESNIEEEHEYTKVKLSENNEDIKKAIKYKKEYYI